MEKVYFFDPTELDRLASENGPGFVGARPFPHVVIDGLFPDELLQEVVDEVPGPEEWRKHPEWRSANRADAVKLMVNRPWMLGPTTRHLLNEFNSAVFINFLEKLTSIEGLIPDPHYFGGGVHQIEAGGFLKIHADFNIHDRLHLDRRLNALLYLNRQWQDEWGGKFELWDKDMQKAVRTVSPVFNRLVIFATTDTSFHGHPDPLTCPPGVTRRSLALYYYTNGRPAEEMSASHSTLHQVRPGENFDPTPPDLKDASADVRPAITWRDFVPPIASKLNLYMAKSQRNRHDRISKEHP